MKKFLIFAGALVTLCLLLSTIGPFVLLCISIWLLYIVFKQFMKSKSVAAKIGWVILGFFIVSIGIANIYGIIGLAAIYILYLLYKQFKKEDTDTFIDVDTKSEDPFQNFEKQWEEFNY